MFVIKNKHSLAHLGDGWQDAYITISSLSFREAKKLANMQSLAIKIQKEGGTPEEIDKLTEHTISIVKQVFVEGKAYNGEGLEPITVENLDELPPYVIEDLINKIISSPNTSPKG